MVKKHQNKEKGLTLTSLTLHSKLSLEPGLMSLERSFLLSIFTSAFPASEQQMYRYSNLQPYQVVTITAYNHNNL